MMPSRAHSVIAQSRWSSAPRRYALDAVDCDSDLFELSPERCSASGVRAKCGERRCVRPHVKKTWFWCVLCLSALLASCAPSPNAETSDALEGEWSWKDGQHNVTITFLSRNRAMVGTAGTLTAFKYEYNEQEKRVKIIGHNLQIEGCLQGDDKLLVKVSGGRDKLFGEGSAATTFLRMAK
jgi:hypothetical protein